VAKLKQSVRLSHSVSSAPAASTATPAAAIATAVHCRFDSASPRKKRASTMFASGLR